ncbi:MAG TPA: hypothetical protein PKH98_01435 [Candidatus Omnitrophota bacterium]|nr:hypothetical protein [Candidatus Omnitrophota bacterium]
MQVKIIDLAYQGKEKEKQLKKLIEKNGHVSYNILTLKSANHIGEKLLSESSKMHFVNPQDDILQISSESVDLHAHGTEETTLVKKANAFLNLLSLNGSGQRP